MIIKFKIFEKVDRSVIDPYGEEFWEDDMVDKIVICIEPSGILEKDKEYIFIKEYEVRDTYYMEVRDKFTGRIIDGYYSSRFRHKKDM